MTKKRLTFKCAETLKTSIKTLEQQPLKFTPAICPLNLEEQKQRFLKLGKLPKFVLKGSEDEIEQLYNRESNQIRFDLYSEAEHILYTVKDKFGDGEKFLTAAYGEKISKEEANEILGLYLKENNLDGAMNIIWCSDLGSSARMMWIGPHAKLKRPEARNFSFWIKNSEDNQFIRTHGIKCLADHEIGTHFFRAFNDGLQPWYSDRRRWGIRGLQSLEQLRTEEGLAAVNTILNAKARYLWGPAMLYYTACKAAEMSFQQLFDHLAEFIACPDNRWRHCARVKRGLIDPNDLGGYGKDQCYFEGAVEILRNIDNLDFNVLMSGKMCVDEVSRCKRLARTDCTRMPAFMKLEKKYKQTLKHIAHINGLNLPHPKVSPPLAYLQRLQRGRRIGPGTAQQVRKRVKKKNRRNRKCKKGSTSSSSESTGESEYEELQNIVNRNTKSCTPWSYVSNSHTVNFIQNDNSNYIENIVSNLDQNVDSNFAHDNPSRNSSISSPLCRLSGDSPSCEFVTKISSEISSITNVPIRSVDSPTEESKSLVSVQGSVHNETEDTKMSESDKGTVHAETENTKTLGSDKGSVYNETGSEKSKLFDAEEADVSSLDMSHNNSARGSSVMSLKSYSFDCESTSTVTPKNNSIQISSSVCSDVATILADEDIRSCSSSIQDVTNEVTLNRLHSGSSLSSCSTVLNDLPVMKSKSTNQSPVFHHVESEISDSYNLIHKSDSVQSFSKSGTEKFIYPDFGTDQFLRSDCTFYLSACSPSRLPRITFQRQSPRLLARRTQSAAHRITLKSLPYVPIPLGDDIIKRKL